MPRASARSAPEPGRPAQPGLRGHHGAQRRRIHVAHRLHLIRVGLHGHVRAGKQDVVHLLKQRSLLRSVSSVRLQWHERPSMLYPHAHPPPAHTCPARFLCHRGAAALHSSAALLTGAAPWSGILDTMSSGRQCQQRRTERAGVRKAGGQHPPGSLLPTRNKPMPTITAKSALMTIHV